MRELLIATHNHGKLEEFKNYLSDVHVKLLTMDDTDIDPKFRVDEAATTFEGNALIKAFICGKKSGKLTVADDSGLEIDALGGEPGVQSARYVTGNDVARYQAVLEKMKDVPDDKRAARFVSVIALYDPITDKVQIARGECEGRITREPKGERGFGYDPIFFADEIQKTFAEASLEEKIGIDHRGKALARIQEHLRHLV